MGADQRCKANAPQADHRDRGTHPDLCRVDNGAHACEHRATEQRCFVQWHAAVDLDDRSSRHRGVLSKNGTSQMMIEGHTLACQSACARQQRARAICGGARFAQGRPTFGARCAMPAAWYEHNHHVIVDLQIGHAFTQLDDNPGRLVPQRHRHGSRAVPVDDRQVRVAQTGRRDLDQDLSQAWRRQIDSNDRQGFRIRVARCYPHLVQNRSSGFHAGRLLNLFRRMDQLRAPWKNTRDASNSHTRLMPVRIHIGDFNSLSRFVNFMFSA